MEYNLEPLNLSSLTLLEVNQLINRHQQNISLVGDSLIVDPVLKSYLDTLYTRNEAFGKGLLKSAGDAHTGHLQQTDFIRDKALHTFVKAVNLSLESDDEQEVEAAKSLALLLSAYKNAADLPYDTETSALDKLNGELENNFAAKVNATNTGKYVVRLKSANSAFKTYFDDKSLSQSLNNFTDNKKARLALLDYYAEATSYLLAMANALKTEQYTKVLALLNGGRKYYAETIAHRKGVAKAEHTDSTSKNEEKN